MVLPHRIELWTSPLPRECSTTELRQRDGTYGVAAGLAAFNTPLPKDQGQGTDTGFRSYWAIGWSEFHQEIDMSGQKPRTPGDRKGRLAAALRANLSKRKSGKTPSAATGEPDQARIATSDSTAPAKERG